MSRFSQVCNQLCKLFYKKEYKRFSAPCDLEAVQKDYLEKLLRKNQETEYGRQYGFADIRSYEDFAEQVPLTVYEDYEPYLEKICEGKARVLTKEPVLLLELTSGSSGGKKLIPYTKDLKEEFQRGIRPWLYDIYNRMPEVCAGKSYWSITPVTAGRSYTKSGIPIGFEEDAEYFGGIEKRLMKQVFAVGGEVKFSSDMQEFYRRTVLELLTCDTLTLISVWNPSYLMILCDFIRDELEGLLVQLPRERQAIVREGVLQEEWEKVFPDLKLISCWADGSAADLVEAVRKRFPHTCIQPKGLLATECFVSVPLVGEEGGRLSLYSHFFEFRSLEDEKIYLAHELRPGRYEVIVTTGGGFYRYCIGDVIEVLEVYPDRPPRLRFLGRRGITSDRFGEKLTEAFVRKVCIGLGLQGAFCLLAPEGSRYCLYTTEESVSGESLDKALRESYHYDYCRELGQLKQAVVCRIYGNPYQCYVDRMTADGMRLGDIKPVYLSVKEGWKDWFQLIREENER